MRVVLPCVIYGAEEKLLRLILAAFQEASAAYGVEFQITMNTNSYNDAKSAIEATQGIIMLISFIRSSTSEEGRKAIKLCHIAAHSNRDNYVVYCAADSRTLVQMTPACIRPAGVIQACSFGLCSKRMFKEVCEDYKRIGNKEGDKDNQWLQVRNRGVLNRIRINDICAILSDNKQVNYHTIHGVVTGYATLEKLEQELPDNFIRCHRTCVINIEKIQYIDYKKMVIILMNGTEVPIARSSKKTVNERIDSQVRK